MIQSWDPSCHKHDYRSLRNRQGSPYYGHALRDVVEAATPQPSIIDRATDFYMTRRWPAVALLILGAAFLGAAIVLATWMLR